MAKATGDWVPEGGVRSAKPGTRPGAGDRCRSRAGRRGRPRPPAGWPRDWHKWAQGGDFDKITTVLPNRVLAAADGARVLHDGA